MRCFWRGGQLQEGGVVWQSERRYLGCWQELSEQAVRDILKKERVKEGGGGPSCVEVSLREKNRAFF